MKMQVILKVGIYDDVYDVTPVIGEYRNGGTAVSLVDANSGEEFATLSVWFPESRMLDDGEFYLKDWSENEPVVKSLKEQGVLIPVKDKPPVHSGFVVSYPYKLKEECYAS